MRILQKYFFVEKTILFCLHKAMLNLSRFLPNDFSMRSRLAIISGRGIYPEILFENAKHLADVYLIAINEETTDSLYEKIDSDKKIKIHIGQIGKMLSFLKKNNIKYAIMAGQIQPKKLFNPLNFDITALSILSKLKLKNAETIFGAVAKEIENIGTQLLDARCFMDTELVSNGNMCKKSPNIAPEYIAHGIMIAKEIARLDIGQAAICKRGTVIAVEDFSGTNDLIKRASKFTLKDAFLVKVSKNNQDFRFDVPIFGKQTIDTMLECGLNTAVLESDSVIFLQKEDNIKFAIKNNLFLLGF